MNIYFLEWNANYEKLMLQNLAELNVSEIKHVMKHFTKNNNRLKRAGINNKLFVSLHVFFKLRKINKEDLIICNGFSILGFIDLIKKLDCKKVLVIRDSMIHLEKWMKERKKWLDPKRNFLDETRGHFDKIYSFDPKDCKEYNLTYLNQFLPFTSSNIENILNNIPTASRNEKRCFFIGEYRKERENVLHQIYTHLNDTDYIADFYLVDKYNESKKHPTFCKNELLSYKENINKVINSDILIEINHNGQQGLTLRTIEALAFNKKIITNNISIKDYAFYSPERFFILEHDNLEDLHIFIENDIVPPAFEIVKQYTSDGMLEKILSDIFH